MPGLYLIAGVGAVDLHIWLWVILSVRSKVCFTSYWKKLSLYPGLPGILFVNYYLTIGFLQNSKQTADLYYVLWSFWLITDMFQLCFLWGFFPLINLAIGVNYFGPQTMFSSFVPFVQPYTLMGFSWIPWRGKDFPLWNGIGTLFDWEMLCCRVLCRTFKGSPEGQLNW